MSDAFHHRPTDSGLSLDELNAAFAEMLADGHDPYGAPPDAADGQVTANEHENPLEISPSDEADVACDITPRSIFEALLFVGSADNQPVTSDRVAGLMRGVRPAEIDDLVRDLNDQYDADARPYRIASDGEGYRLALREEFGATRDKFLGRSHEATLSPAAVEVLSIIAYNGPQTSDDVARLRGRPSGPILAQLVRRQLLNIKRDPAAPRRARYQTTPRFLTLLGIETLDDLPRGQDLERR